MRLQSPIRLGLGLAAYVALSILAACVTINVYFPEAAVKDLSEKIEAEIREQAQEEGEESAEETAPGMTWNLRAVGSALAHLFVAPVYAAEATAQAVPEPEITNPAIRRIIDSRAERLDEINRHKSTGVLGENNQALLEIRDLDAVSDLRERAAVQRLVKAENNDREQLFKEIAAAQDVDLSQLPKIRATYAQTLRENARKGDWIQMPDGSWRQK
jgi:uncharacterized protein YdbL (DUF1318 family)